MDRDQIRATFDRQAPTCDRQWSKLSALREGLHLLLVSVFATLPARARILCVGAGTGAEIQHLAESDVAVRPAQEIECIIVSGGFESPVSFFQAGLIHAWYSKRAAALSQA